MEVSHLESLPNEILYQVVLDLDDSALFQLCKTSRRFADPCQDEDFWRQRYFLRYPEFHSREEATLFEPSFQVSWRQIYWDAIHSAQPVYLSPRFRQFYRELKELAPQISDGHVSKTPVVHFSSELIFQCSK
jgi:hypothetical protein